MNKSIKYLGFSFFGALLLLVLGAAGPIFIPVNNGTGNTTTLNNPKTAGINDLNGTTRIIQIAGGSSGFNDGFGVNRVQIDAGGVIKLKATNAAQLFQLTADGYGEASFPWTFDNGILVGGSTNSAVWLWNGNSAHYYQSLFTDASGNTVIEPDNNLQILHADVTIDKSVAAERAFATNGLFTFGSGSGAVFMQSSNGLGGSVIKPAHNLPVVITNEFNFTNAAPGQILTVISSNNNKIVWGVSNAASSGSMVMTMGFGNSSPNTNLVQWWGAPTSLPVTQSSSFSNVWIRIPKSGTISRFELKIYVNSVAGSTETFTNDLIWNSTVVTSVVMGYNLVNSNVTVTGLSQAVSAGDTLLMRINPPTTMTTKPTGVFGYAAVLIDF